MIESNNCKMGCVAEVKQNLMNENLYRDLDSKRHLVGFNQWSIRSLERYVVLGAKGCSLACGDNLVYQLSVGVTCHAYLLEIECLFTQG